VNIVLIGYRGAGKSAVGEILSGRLGMPCVAMDAEIVRKAGMSIPEIVEKYGWEKFRELESNEARELAGRDGIIIDTGGGVVERSGNVEILRRNARVFWLLASAETIVSRIRSGSERPALSPGKTFTEEVSEVLARRTPLYRDAAHNTIDTDGSTPEQVADRIVGILRPGRR
jgi:shikimate kinase